MVQGNAATRPTSPAKLPWKNNPPGNPLNKVPFQQPAKAFRILLYRCVKPGDFIEVIELLVREAKKGKAWAIKELLDRTCGAVSSEKTLEVTANTAAPIRIIMDVGDGDDPVGRAGA